MLELIRTQLTDESETDGGGNSTGRGIVSESRNGADGPIDDIASRGMTTHASRREPTIELDEVFGLLKNRRRRDVLRYLTENPTEVRLGKLSEQIAARECEKDVSQINSQERKRVYVGLYQCHLPKLADVGVIEYKKPRGIIERGPAFDQVTQYLPAEESPTEQDVADRPLKESLYNKISAARFFR